MARIFALICVLGLTAGALQPSAADCGSGSIRWPCGVDGPQPFDCSLCSECYPYFCDEYGGGLCYCRYET